MILLLPQVPVWHSNNSRERRGDEVWDYMHLYRCYMFYIFYYFPPRVHPLISSATAHYFAQNNAQWHWGGTNSSNIRTGSRCPLLSMMCLMHPPFAKYVVKQINNFRRYCTYIGTTTTPTPPSFSFFSSFIIFTYVSLFVSCLLTTAARRGIGESVYSLFFSQQRVSQLIFSPLADEREVGGGSRTRATTTARLGQRYVHVIAHLFVSDIVSHLFFCLSPHP